MYTDPKSASELASKLKSRIGNCDWADIAIFPPFICIPAIVDAVFGSRIAVGGQNAHWENEGAFTGEISPVMLKNSGCTMVIIGHSERRVYFSESDAMINNKVRAALSAGLRPILCIGETLEQRESGIAEKVIERQLLSDLNETRDLNAITLAYEPVWAIGTGRNATPEQASDIHQFIRQLVSTKWGKAAADEIKILYGGSVKPDNATALAARENIDGFLVGGASLKVDSFEAIISAFK
jgi:triosephosphate isomerase